MNTKVCSKCLLAKNLSEFENRPDSKDGKRAYCRICKIEQSKKAYNKRLSNNVMTFWKTRANYLNSCSGRRNGKAGTIIKNSPKISAESIKLLYEINNKCFYCSVSLSKDQIVFDHKIPLSRNGSHDIENLCICCQDCNQLKSSRTDKEFLVFIEEYMNRFIGNTVLSK